jgi:hypothetical protein
MRMPGTRIRATTLDTNAEITWTLKSPSCCNATHSASRRVPSLIAMKQRMGEKGKAPKTFLIAIGRQLLAILNAMIRSRTTIRL